MSADQRFEYSAVYRLTRAEGREHAAAQRPTHTDVAFGTFPDPGDPAARAYVQTYGWDRVGNLERMQHTGQAPQIASVIEVVSRSSKGVER